jgi:hypothetical protein
MATYSYHGGSCCGMRHIYEFHEDQQTNINNLVRVTNEVGANDRLNLEVILSDLQTQTNPELLRSLARLGYTYTTAWTGQHGTPVHLFHRAKKRLALEDAHFYNRWVNEYNGMVVNAGLGGDLPPWNETQPHQVGRLLLGQLVRNIGNSTLQGLVGVVVEVSRCGLVTVRYATGRTITYTEDTELLEVIGQAPEQEAPPTVYRHPRLGGQPPVAERRLILSQFYCVFRESGRPSRVFNTLAEGQQAYPRAIDWHERKVYSDGEIVEGLANHG